MLAQLLHRFGNPRFELRIVTLAHELWILLHFDVRRDTVTLDFPLAVQSADRHARRHDATAVHQRRITADADQSAPRLHADERSESRLAEDPRHCVTA